MEEELEAKLPTSFSNAALLWALMGTLAMGWSPAHGADVLQSPQIGDKVRIDFTREERGERDPVPVVLQRTGRLAAMDSTSWRLEIRHWNRPSTDAPEQLMVPLADFERLRIYDRRSNARGAWRGAAWGLGLGAAFAVFAGVDHDHTPPDRTGNQALWLVPAGVLIGALAGGGIGADEWREYPVRQLLSESVNREQP